MRNRNANKTSYIPIEVVVAHLAGVAIAGDWTAAKRTFVGQYPWWYPRSSEPVVTTVWEEWANGSALQAGQGAFASTSVIVDEETDALTARHRMQDVARHGTSTGILQPASARPETSPLPGLRKRLRRRQTLPLHQRIANMMLEALDSGKMLLDELVSETEEALAKRWEVTRTPAREARKAVLAEKDPNLLAAIRAFERHVRDGDINVCQIGSGGLPWSIPSGLWGPGSLKRWTGGLVLDGGQYYWGKIFSNLEVLLADAERIDPGCTTEAASHERAPTSTRPRRGPRPQKSEAVERAMCEQIERGTLSRDELRRTKEEALVAEYGSSRTTVRRARNSVLAARNSISE
jgi:hypothetical protein